MKTQLRPLIALAMLVLAALACGSSTDGNAGQVIGNSTSAPTNPPAQAQTYGVGEIIQVQNHTIVLNSYEFAGNVLKANFTIENQGSEEISISSLLSFSARDSQGTRLDTEIFDCGSSLNGSVLAGDVLRGDICWTEANTDSAKIYYEASLFGSGSVVWQVSK